VVRARESERVFSFIVVVGQRETYRSNAFCDDYKTVPFCLPPHSTHLLQPPDVVVFQPYKHYHAEGVDNVNLTGCSGFNKFEFLAAITSIRQQAFKPSTITSTPRKTSLISYNPKIVLERLQEYNAEREPGLGDRCTPSPSPSAQPITTPHTARSLKRHTDAVIAELFKNRPGVSHRQTV
jgi:hypothetical protein